MTNTGRTSKGMFGLPNGAVIKMDSLIYNCHVCKKIFSPIKATLVATNEYGYLNGDTWSRKFIIAVIEEDKVCDCSQSRTIVMYDNIDPMVRKFGKEKNHGIYHQLKRK